MVGTTTAGRWLIAFSVLAQAPPTSDANSPPSQELLLFLAQFSDGQGHYVDPVEIEAATAATAIDDSKTDSKENHNEHTQHDPEPSTSPH